MPSSFKPSTIPGRLHHYSSRLVAFEHYRADRKIDKKKNKKKKNFLLWIGGLGDGLLTVPYVRGLAQDLPPGWVLVEVLLSSSYNGWGMSSLKKDVKELERCIGCLMSGTEEEEKEVGAAAAAAAAATATVGEAKKIVLMGHSTGCQDVMEYLVGRGRGRGSGRDGSSGGDEQQGVFVQGAILQAPVSDREGLVRDLAPSVYESSVRMAQDRVAQGRGEDALPASATGGMYGSTPISARRWLSLASPDRDGDDDYFSSDLSDEQLRSTFGRLPGGNGRDDKACPILVLYSGQDEHVPDSVDKEALVRRWTGIMKENGVVVDEENGGVLPGAHHSFKQDSEEIVQDLIRRVRGFLVRTDDGS